MTNLKFRLGRVAARGERESGQALIELAVSLPLFLVMLLGAAEMARLAYMAIEVSEAAKGAAQYGAQNEASALDYGSGGGIVQAAQKNAPYVYANCSSFSATVAHQSTQPNLPCSCVAGGTPSTPSYAACSAACTGYVVQVLQVSTTASCNPLIHGIGFPIGSITLHGGAIQEVLN